MEWVRDIESRLNGLRACGLECSEAFAGARKLIAAVRLADREVKRALEHDVLIPLPVAETLGVLRNRLRSGEVEDPQ